jgi:hypothetical protein
MKYLKIIVSLFFVFINSLVSFSQEFNCQVTILLESKVEASTADKALIEQLKTAMYEFMNNQQWTNDKFKTEERINCQIQLQITAIPSYGQFNGSMQVQSSRPAFSSSYNTTLFNFDDKEVQIAYTGGTALILPKNGYRDNLSSILAFYGYFILGMDYDSFSLKGGTPYFTQAQQIVTNAQSSGGSGWQSGETGKGKRNRYWLVDNVLHQLFEPLRECNYEYHRNGIDMLYEDKVKGRKAITDALMKLNKITATRPNSVNLLNFCQAKVVELKNLYIDADPKEKTEIVNLLKKIDPANSSKYEQILN